MKKIAIKPHKTRGIELIEILERMGGYNSHHLDGFSFRDDTAYLIDEDGIITSYTEHLCHEKGYKIYTLEEWEDEYKSDEMIEGLVEEENLIERVDDTGLPFNEWLSHKGAFHVPDGYELKDENGNIINATKIVLEKKKKEYPKTYKDCCKVLNIAVRDLDILDNMLDTTDIIYSKNLDRLLNSFRKLLICRDAYWKIAGEEMGLGKPWEPVYQDDKQDKHCIYVDIWGVTLHQDNIVQHVLSFPTEEMRDTFYENFKIEIEECKELL